MTILLHGQITQMTEPQKVKFPNGSEADMAIMILEESDPPNQIPIQVWGMTRINLVKQNIGHELEVTANIKGSQYQSPDKPNPTYAVSLQLKTLIF